jgi:hypothetical protein
MVKSCFAMAAVDRFFFQDHRWSEDEKSDNNDGEDIRTPHPPSPGPNAWTGLVRSTLPGTIGGWPPAFSALSADASIDETMTSSMACL